MRSSIRSAFVLSAIALAAACGPVPRPFAPDPRAPTAAILVPSASAGVVVEPVAGMPPDAGRALAELLAGSLQKADIVASTRVRNPGSFTLRGRLDPASGGRIAMLELRNPQGEAVGSHALDVGGADLAGPAGGSAWQLRGDEAAKAVVAMIHGTAEPPVDASVQQPVALASLSGLPPQETRTLARSLEHMLRRARLQLAEEPGPDTLKVTGVVKVSPAKVPTDRVVEVVWTVLGKDGQELGKVEQANDVPARLLDQAWPEIAAAVAEAAAGGIAEIVQQNAPPPARPAR